jgi:hypothetical protein
MARPANAAAGPGRVFSIKNPPFGGFAAHRLRNFLSSFSIRARWLLLCLLLHHCIVRFLDAPERICEPRHHRRRWRQLSTAAGRRSRQQKLIGHLEGHRCGQFCQLLAEPVRAHFLRFDWKLSRLASGGKPCGTRSSERDGHRRSLKPRAPRADVESANPASTP